jgi:pantoate--beta-alanine ligase
MQALALQYRRQGRSVGFVPTMGALHAGHASLVKRARRENDIVVVSIFVNPLQFGPKEDFKEYPRTISRDLALLKKDGVDIVFRPDANAMYPEGFSTCIRVPSLDTVLEGAFRPGHFQGVATVVMKLLNLVLPTRAYFGDKDYQQVRVIHRMIDDLNIPVRLISCRTMREKDGLALSSRNRYLSKEEREEAIKIHQALYLGQELISGKLMRDSRKLVRRLSQIFSRVPRCKIDYIAVLDPETLEPMKKIRRPALLAAAVKIGKTRLIDNVIIP